jgi:hypothetical protein
MSAKPFDSTDAAWIDLRERPVDIMHWAAHVVDGLLHIKMNDAAVQRFKESVRDALASGTSPEHKLRLINAAARSFHYCALRFRCPTASG